MRLSRTTQVGTKSRAKRTRNIHKTQSWHMVCTWYHHLCFNGQVRHFHTPQVALHSLRPAIAITTHPHHTGRHIKRDTNLVSVKICPLPWPGMERGRVRTTILPLQGDASSKVKLQRSKRETLLAGWGSSKRNGKRNGTTDKKLEPPNRDHHHRHHHHHHHRRHNCGGSSACIHATLPTTPTPAYDVVHHKVCSD